MAQIVEDPETANVEGFFKVAALQSMGGLAN